VWNSPTITANALKKVWLFVNSLYATIIFYKNKRLLMQENQKQNNEIELIDEALASEPIKNTFRLGWEFVVINRQFTLTAMLLFIILNLLGMIPLLELISMVCSAVFALVVQIYVGKTFYFSNNIKNYVSAIEKSRVEGSLTPHIAPAFGGYMGWFALGLIFVFLFSFIAGSMGLISANMNENDLLNLIFTLGMPLLLIFLTLSYVQPLVQANIILSNNFREGFRAVFTLFSFNLWRKSFHKAYFSYVTIFGTLLISVMFVSVFIVGALGSMVGLGLVMNILLLVVTYVFMIMMAIGSVMAKRIVEKK
jgi:hypothetical protein